MPPDASSPERSSANPSYAAFQIARALATAESHEGEATRERAWGKMARWIEVLQGMLGGRLTVGSRQPIDKMPVWVTPEVVMGGFVTGRAMANGPWQSHELDRLGLLGIAPGVTDRRPLNAWHLSEAGLAELTARLESRNYEISVPEEGALLVVAWLCAHGHPGAARELIDTIAPHFESLRFYPAPRTQPLKFGDQLHLESVGDALQHLGCMRPRPHILAQRAAIQVRLPYYDRMVALFLETVAGEPPGIALDSEGRWTSPASGKFNVVGGWPCQVYPPDWKTRALQTWAEGEQNRSDQSPPRKARSSKDTCARLHDFLKMCVENPAALSGRDVGSIRLILARHMAKHGGPGSEKLRALRHRQALEIRQPTFPQIASVVEARLAGHDSDGGLDDIEPILRLIEAGEDRTANVPALTEVPGTIRKKVARCLNGTAEELIKRNIIKSGDTLARVIPQFTAGVRSHSISDPALCHLYAAIYFAFRRRRSLLLLNLEKQVQIEELPWVSAIEPFRRPDQAAAGASRQALQDLAALTLKSFPHAIIPNKLLPEFGVLAREAGQKLPLVEELAADIFMDDFSPKFTEAAKRAGAQLEGSLYARYYGIDYAAVRALPEDARKAERKDRGINPFAAMCISRTPVSNAQRWDAARNGMVIEQAQVITTHNLAVLFEVLDLGELLRDQLPCMARHCFEWICHRHKAPLRHRHDALIMLKLTAYAWRQMLFYLSLLSPAEQLSFVPWAEEYLRGPAAAVAGRLSPLISGLAAVMSGRSLDDRQAGTAGLWPFLGWSHGKHWLLAGRW